MSFRLQRHYLGPRRSITITLYSPSTPYHLESRMLVQGEAHILDTGNAVAAGEKLVQLGFIEKLWMLR